MTTEEKLKILIEMINALAEDMETVSVKLREKLASLEKPDDIGS
jgi:hypothetical protein